MQGVGKGGIESLSQGAQFSSASTHSSGPGAAGGQISTEKDSKDAATAPKFGDIYNQIQSKFGAKAEKPREIKKTLGKDDFLRIMITQLKNQDPTSPFKAEQMATEVAQFTTVEQLQNVNQNLIKMGTQNRPLEQLAMTGMIGKTVTIDRTRFPHAEGQTETLSFNLPKNAVAVHAALVSDAGETVLEKDLGSQKAGESTFNWDGLKTNSLPAKGGNYLLRIEAKDERGQSIETNPQATARIIGVSFEGSEPVFLVGDAQHQDKITLRNIVRVDMEVSSAQNGQGIVPVQNQPDTSPKFVTFQKGVGSNNFLPDTQDPQKEVNSNINKVIENYKKAPLQDLSANEKGFPNGLHDTDPVAVEVSNGGDKK